MQGTLPVGFYERGQWAFPLLPLGSRLLPHPCSSFFIFAGGGGGGAGHLRQDDLGIYATQWPSCGREVVSLPRGLEEDHHPSVGASDFISRLCPTFHGPTSSCQEAITDSPSSHCIKVRSTLDGSPVSPTWTRALSRNCCQTKGRGYYSHYFLLMTEKHRCFSVWSSTLVGWMHPPHREVQNRDPAFYSLRSSAGYVDGIFRCERYLSSAGYVNGVFGSDRYLSSRSSLSSTQEVSAWGLRWRMIGDPSTFISGESYHSG